MINGISQLNIELTSRCNKRCFFCGHQDSEINKTLKYGDMEFRLLEHILIHVPRGTWIQFHRDGEPLLYRDLLQALLRCREFGLYTNIVTNGKLLKERSGDIIGKLDSLTVSVFFGDTEGDEQYSILRDFLEIKKDRPPLTMVKVVGGGVDKDRYRSLGIPIIERQMHIRQGSRGYQKTPPIIPEIGVCLDLMHHPSIDWQGNVHLCNRLDSEGRGIIGNIGFNTLDEILNGEKRRYIMRQHLSGRRDKVEFCKNCEFWGIPNG